MTMDEISQLAFSGDYIGALDATRTANIDTQKNHAGAFISGYCYYHLQRFDEALTQFEAAIRLAPQSGYSMMYAVLANQNAGRTVEALILAIKYIGVWPKSQSEDELKTLLRAAMECIAQLPLNLERIAIASGLLVLFRKAPNKFGLEQHILTALVNNPQIDNMASLKPFKMPDQSDILFGKIMTVHDAIAAGYGQYDLQTPPDKIHFLHLDPKHKKNTPEKDIFEGYPGYVARLKDVIVSGLSSAVFSQSGGVISDSYADERYGMEVDLRADEIIRYRINQSAAYGLPKISQEIDLAINLSGLASNQFGHWFSEYLPRLRHFCQLPDFSKIPILINSDMPDTHKDFLAALCDNPIIPVDRNEAVFVRSLLVAPTITFFPFDLRQNHTVPVEHQACWSGAALRFLRERIFESIPENPNITEKDIYLSRQNRTWGRPSNEDQFVNAVTERGIKPVFLEKMDFAEQVNMIRNADTIIAPTGSALNMLVFARPEARILIFSQKHPHNWGGWAGPLNEIGIFPKFAQMEEGSSAQKHAAFEMRIDALDALFTMRP